MQSLFRKFENKPIINAFTGSTYQYCNTCNFHHNSPEI